MKKKKLNMRSSRMRTLQTEPEQQSYGSYSSKISTTSTPEFPPIILGCNNDNIISSKPMENLWSNVKFENKSEGFILTYTNTNPSYIYLGISLYTDPEFTIKDVTFEYDSNAICNISIRNIPVSFGRIDSGAYNGGNVVSLPFRLIIFVKDFNIDKIIGYFYLDIDREGNVTDQTGPTGQT